MTRETRKDIADVADFMEMAASPTAAKKRGKRIPNKVIFVCTACKKVQAPTSERNIRCRGCNAPLIESLENLTTIRNEIKAYYLYPDIVKKLKAKVKMIKLMKVEQATILGSRVVTERIHKAKAGSLKGSKTSVFIFHLTIMEGTVAQYPKGFKGKLKVPAEKSEAFQKKCENLGITYHLVATEREYEVMEDIRQSMIEKGG